MTIIISVSTTWSLNAMTIDTVELMVSVHPMYCPPTTTMSAKLITEYNCVLAGSTVYMHHHYVRYRPLSRWFLDLTSRFWCFFLCRCGYIFPKTEPAATAAAVCVISDAQYTDSKITAIQSVYARNIFLCTTVHKVLEITFCNDFVVC